MNVISDLGSSLEVFGDLGFAQNCVWWTGFCSGKCFVIAVGVFDKLGHWFYFRQKLIVELVWVLCKLHEILKISIVAHIPAHYLTVDSDLFVEFDEIQSLGSESAK